MSNSVSTEVLLWSLFIVFVTGALALDLGVFHRRPHIVPRKEAALWTLVWIALALVFNILIYFWIGSESAIQFLTAYLLEKSLSMDNIFVFVVIFTYFSVDAAYHHRVLFWGIMGAVILRGLFIAGGLVLVHAFESVLLVFGAFLIFTGIRFARQKEISVNPEANPVVRLFRKFLPLTESYQGSKFLVNRNGKTFATPLFIVLLVIETTDVAFAIDSIPAAFAVTTDPLVVFTSNIFAILGLRALYFLVAAILPRIRYLRLGLSATLVYLGFKVLIAQFYPIPIIASLLILSVILGASMLASAIFPKRIEPTAT